MTLIVYGIKNCDTCRKALKWLEAESIEHEYHDFRAHGLSDRELIRWVDAQGWETVLNRRGTTWRKLPDAEKAAVGRDRAVALMLENPTLVKRPVFDDGERVFVGFDDAVREALAG